MNGYPRVPARGGHPRVPAQGGHPVLEALAREGVRLGLDRIAAFLDFLGAPHRCAPVVHVAGTNGKGSVCGYVTSALVAAGYRVGTTISPHVQTVNERVQIGGVPIDDAALAAAIESVDQARRAWARRARIDGEALTYFEFVTAVAFVVFAERRVDVQVVEVGMGGRLDATNVVEPLVCAIPSIGLDHTRDLGPDLASIAGEKAGVLKAGRPAVIGPMAPEAEQVFVRVAAERDVPLWTGADLRHEARPAGRWDLGTPEGELLGVTLGMAGAHQGINAAVALGALHRARGSFAVPDSAIRQGFATTAVPARLERLGPRLVVDGAHNPDGTRALAAWLTTAPRPRTRVLLFGMGEDRDPIEVIAPLLGTFDRLVTTRGTHPKARDPQQLAAILAPLVPDVVAGGPIERALPQALAEADEVVVTGSLFVAGAARSLWQEQR